MTTPGKYALLNDRIIRLDHPFSDPMPWQDWLNPAAIFHWRASGSRIPFYAEQYSRMKLLEETLSLRISGWEDPDKTRKNLISLIQKNRHFKGIRLTIRLHPAAPESSQFLCLVTTADYPADRFELNPEGLILTDMTEVSHPGGREILMRGDQGLEAWYRKQQAAKADGDDWMFSDSQGALLESSAARIYLVKQEKVFTPLHPDIRRWGIEAGIRIACRELNLSLVESPSLQQAHLLQAEEVFLANDFEGIRWVKGYGNKRYFRKLSQKILDQLNKQWSQS